MPLADYQALLARSDIQAVSLCLPDRHHTDVAIAAARAGEGPRLIEAVKAWAIEAGYPRRNYGTDSSDYASEAAAAGSWRYGVTSAFTIESHGEVGDNLQNVGVGGLLRLGRRFGVLSAALACSRLTPGESRANRYIQ